MAPSFSDCQVINVGRIIDSLLSTSINSICSSKECGSGRVVSPSVEPFVEPHARTNQGVIDVSCEMATPTTANHSKPTLYRHSQSLPANLNGSFRDRKPSGLSISAHNLSELDSSNPQSGPISLPAPIYCAKNVEMRRKSLKERHFFRPVSEDDESDFTFGQ